MTVISTASEPSARTRAVVRPGCERSNSIATSSIQCGRCQRSIACARAALVVVATCHGKKADFGSRVSRTSGGTITA